MMMQEPKKKKGVQFEYNADDVDKDDDYGS